ncbi:hypothetical protein ATX23_09445 [Oenococcus oeni]|uniref:hypothetical protein n=1 Tax=Oenococcus oeni TaxID=1247 RepID=UPI0008F7E930|nr:hypothetical protein [Oenococcus oeni]OIL58321.1 hypothetical protein ATX23_09445 [Oenococcus oeni]
MTFKKVGTVENIYDNSLSLLEQFPDSVIPPDWWADVKLSHGEFTTYKSADVYTFDPVKLPKFVVDWFGALELTPKDNDISSKVKILSILFDNSRFHTLPKEVQSWLQKTPNSDKEIVEAILYGYEIDDDA